MLWATWTSHKLDTPRRFSRQAVADAHSMGKLCLAAFTLVAASQVSHDHDRASVLSRVFHNYDKQWKATQAQN